MDKKLKINYEQVLKTNWFRWETKRIITRSIIKISTRWDNFRINEIVIWIELVIDH